MPIKSEMRYFGLRILSKFKVLLISQTYASSKEGSMPYFRHFFQADSSAIEDDWKFAAMVLDRCCLILFTAYTVILSATVFLSASHIFVY